jgi:hypothetical protein
MRLAHSGVVILALSVSSIALFKTWGGSENVRRQCRDEASYKEHDDASFSYHTKKPPVTDYISSLQELEPVRIPTYTSRKPARHNKLRNVPPLVTAYRPLSGSGTTRHKKSLRPKQEPVSPVMSGYGVSLWNETCCTLDHLQ